MLIQIKVKTKQKEASVEKVENNLYLIKVKSLPIEGKANLEVIDLLAKYFEVKKSQVKIKTGESSKIKLVEIVEIE